jgi:hypothetical protein
LAVKAGTALYSLESICINFITLSSQQLHHKGKANVEFIDVTVTRVLGQRDPDTEESP